MGWLVAEPGWFDGFDGFDGFESFGFRLLGVEGLELLGVPLFGVELRSDPVPVGVDGVVVWALVDGDEVLDGFDWDGVDCDGFEWEVVWFELVVLGS